MNNTRWLAAVVLVTAFIAGGCASNQTHDTQSSVQPMSTYSSMDATALVYTDPAALSPTSDHPLRWLGFIGHPVGTLLDYAINRPLYALASRFPGLFGYTSEDAMLDSQRPAFR
jgi:hypothetical protein